MLRLNEQQRAAASFTNGIAAVVAVPGSGKTLTMTHRIANLVKNHGVMPESILGLTFTRNAARAMRDKLKPILKDQSSRVHLSTIHSFAYALLKDEGIRFELLQGSEQIKFVKSIMKKKKILNLPVGIVIREIGLAKNNLMMPAEFKTLYEGDQTMERIGEVYELYELEKKKRMLMDFNDLLVETCHLLTHQKEVMEKYANTYRHVLVDEVQDTNPSQWAILRLLVGNAEAKESSFYCTGDDWQSIYSFTGASVGNILNFKKTYPKSRQFVLETNYRSTPQILRSCMNLIRHNVRKIDKTLNTDNPDGDQVMVIEAVNEEDEAVKIVNEIKHLVSRSMRYKDIAILYRANNQSRVVEEVLLQHKIPYHIENGLNFYHRMEVKVLLDYLRLIHLPDSDEGDEALKSVINIPNRYIGRAFINELEAYAAEKDIHLYPAIQTLLIQVPYIRKYVREFIGLMNPLIKDAKGLEPSEVLHVLRQSLDYDACFSEDATPSADDSKVANINQLQIASAKYNDLGSFLNYTASFKEEMSDAKDGVALMTVHKSKGLEFPVVFVIGLIDGVMPNHQGDIEEERRIAFVGISRAMRLLYLTHPTTYMGKSARRSQFLDEIRGE